jgi:hypothetical protein
LEETDRTANRREAEAEILKDSQFPEEKSLGRFKGK